MSKTLKKWLRRLGLGFGILLLLLFLAWVFRWQLFGGMIRDAVTGALADEGIEAEVGEMSGTLIGDVTVTKFRIVRSPGHPEIEEASFERVHASYSVFGLLTGKPGWIEIVEIEGLRAGLDLAKALPSEEPEPEETESGGFDRGILPRQVKLVDIDVSVRSGENRFELTQAELTADCGLEVIRGTFGASRAFLAVEGEERTGEPVSGEFSFENDQFTVSRFTTNTIDHGTIIALDLARLDESRLKGDIRLPLLDGLVGVKVDLDLSGDSPFGVARIALEDIDPRPAFRFISDVPVQLRRLDAVLDVTLPPGVEPGLTTLAAEFDITLDHPGYDVWGADRIHLAGKVEDGRIEARGRFTGPDGKFDADVTLTGEERILATVDFPTFDLALLKQAPEGLPIRGTARISAKVEGGLDNPDLRADVRVEQPRFGHFDADLLEVVADGTPEKSMLRHLLVTRGEDRLVVTGVVEPLDEVRFEGEVELEIGAVEDYLKLLPEGIPTDAAGSLKVNVTTRGTPEAPGAKARITMEMPRGAGFAADRLSIEAEVPDVETFRASRVTLVNAADLIDLEVTDALAAIDAAGDATLSVGKVSFARTEWGLAGDLKATMEPNGAVRATVSLNSMDVAAMAGDLGLDIPVRGDGSGSLEIGGTVDAPEVDARITVTSPAVAPEGRPEVVADDIVIRFSHRNGLAKLEQLRLGGPDWELTASGSVPLDLENPDATADAPFENVNIAIRWLPLALAGPVPGLAEKQGTLTGDFKLTGNAGAPVLNGNIALADGRFVLEDMPDLPIEGFGLSVTVSDLSPGGGTVRLEKLAADVLGTRIEASGSTRLVEGGIEEPKFKLIATGADLARLTGALAPDVAMKGVAALEVEIHPEPRLSIGVTVADLEVAGHADCRLDLGAEWRNGTIDIKRGVFVAHDRKLSISGQAPLDLTLAPFAIGAPLDRPLDLRFQSEGLELGDLVTDQQDMRLTGKAFVDIAVKGTYETPLPDGKVTVSGARVRLPGAPQLSRLDATILLKPDRITVKSLSGLVGHGSLDMSGTIGIVDQAPAAIDLTVIARNAQLVRSAGLRLRSDLDLTVKGPSPAALTVAGKVKVRSLRAGGSGLFAAQDLELILESLRSQPSLAPLPITSDPALKDIVLDVEVTIPPETTKVRNNIVNMAIEGKLSVGGTLAIPRPDGRIYIPSGGLVYLVAGSLEIDTAVITFKKAEPLRPYVQIRAVAEISDTEISVDVSGPPNDTKILFSSVPPMDETNIVSLLLTGVTRDALASGSGARGLAQAYLLRQLSSNLSSDDGEEPSTLSELVSRVEVEVDSQPANSSGTPAIRATVEILEWLFVRVSQEASDNYGADLIFRITRP